PLQQHAREALAERDHEGLNERVVLGAADALMPPADVQRIVQQLLVVRADIENDRQRRRRMDAGAHRVQRQLADRDAHAADTEIAQPEDALAVGDDHDADVLRPEIRERRVDRVALRIRNVQAARPAVDAAIGLARLPDHRGVDDRHHLDQVLAEQPVERGLVAILQRHQVDVAFEVGRLLAIVAVDARELHLGRGHARRQQSVQAELAALVLGERAALVEEGLVEQCAASEWSLQVLLAATGVAADFEEGVHAGERLALLALPCSARYVRRSFSCRIRPPTMAMNFLDFEAPIAELEAKIDELKFVSSDAEVNIADEIARLRAKSRALTTSIFSNLTQWQIAQLARHPQRPYTLDYVGAIFTDFQELHGDRMYSDDHAIVGGPARLDGMPVMIVGQQKGRDTKERVRRNYGMPKPEGYRKALRLMRMAERFQLPLITFIDTSGAYPGVGAEERGQSEAIARNLFEMSTLRTPIVSIVIGEGGSGGALAIGVGDRLLMLQYSIYSVISPEGCAGILWRSADKKDLAAEAMGVSAERIAKLGIVDEVVKEPLGGAHRDPQVMADTVKDALLRHLGELQALSLDQVVEKRQERLRNYGVYSEG